MNPIFDAISGGISGILKPILDKAFPDANERLKAEEAATAALNSMVLAQVQVNLVEASSPSVFVAGWRPFIGWICGSAFAYSFVVQPFLVFLLTAFQVHVDSAQLPVLATQDLMVVLGGMLGLGAMRSYDKTQGGK